MTRWVAHALVFFAVLVTVSLGGFTFLASPVATKRDQLAHDIAKLEGLLQALDVVAARQAEFTVEVRQIESEQAQLDRVVPQNAEEQPYLRAFDAEARELGVVLSSLRWAKRETREVHIAAPFTLTVRGEKSRVLSFASRILAGEPLVEVQSVELKDGARPLAELTLKAEAISAAPAAQ